MKSAGHFLLAVTALGWTGCAGLALHWRFAIAPNLDGSEGSGVGFGWMFVHRFAPALAFSLSVVILLIYGLVIFGHRWMNTQRKP